MKNSQHHVLPDRGGLLTDSSDSEEVKTYTHMHATHLCTHLLTYTLTHSQADSRTYVHSLDTYKNLNTNTNNTTIKTLYLFLEILTV